ncbi:non-receptor serine/threonine protein kinase [Lithospermum erythrorhizon]|uniref:mitogen-activated protein kinase kinase n=1 Tax=Lithospermum erythrorhizon TaxID=34254 RepID=A0AAV3RBL4_LITER
MGRLHFDVPITTGWHNSQRVVMEIAAMAAIEIQVNASVNHENIVQCIGLIFCHGYISILMENLSRNMENFNTTNDEKMKSIALQLLNVLKYLKDMSIVYLDLKPQNILSTDSSFSVIKLCDFGSSKFMSDENVFVHGTELYASPESQKRLKVSPDCPPASIYKTDVFSLGVCLIQFFHGSYPFSKQSHLLDLVESEVPGLLAKASPKFKNFVVSCVHRNPAERLSVEELLRHPFIVDEFAHSDVFRPHSIKHFARNHDSGSLSR